MDRGEQLGRHFSFLDSGTTEEEEKEEDEEEECSIYSFYHFIIKSYFVYFFFNSLRNWLQRSSVLNLISYV